MKLRSYVRFLLAIIQTLFALFFVVALTGFEFYIPTTNSKIDVHGPYGSDSFGETVIVLPNGNLVIPDPNFDDILNPNIGAVHLYDGRTGKLISTLRGKRADDHVGSGGVTLLSNGHYVVSSPQWDAPDIGVDAGAVTWCDGAIGCSGTPSNANSLVGSQAYDQVGNDVVTLLENEHYVVLSPHWDAPGPVMDVGAVTWCDGSNGCIGVVSDANSLVGGQSEDWVGSSFLVVLSNGNYVVRSLYWDAPGPVMDVGAVTWCDGTSGCIGAVSAANSLVGGQSYDQVGYFFSELSHGNYVVRSPFWDAAGPVMDVGAVTWCDGTNGCVGAVSAANSLVGGQVNDWVGFDDVTELSNGLYVVRSLFWDAPGPVSDVGALTWCDGKSLCSGLVSTTNSLVGSQAHDWVGLSVIELRNGNYVVGSPFWNAPGPVTSVGAVTWCDGASGCIGSVSDANSLVGVQTYDWVGLGDVIALNNGHYVVRSPHWDAPGPVMDVGAVTWCDGTSGCSGVVSAANSLIGAQSYDRVGSIDLTVLSNGNYVVRSPFWNAPGPVSDAGAVTWCDGASGCIGVVSTANSLVGGHAYDQVGYYDITVLRNDRYVVHTPDWDASDFVANAGAVTWCDGDNGCNGTISTDNSLVGDKANDQVGLNVIDLSNGNYVVRSSLWDAPGPVSNVGAVTWCDGVTGCNGTVSDINSLVGDKPEDQVGFGEITVLNNGNYVVTSIDWDAPGPVTDVGAVTWCDGTRGCAGTVSDANSLVGGQPYDWVGIEGVTELSNGHFVVHSPYWDDPEPVTNVGAVTWLDRTSGPITASNSVIGGVANQGFTMVWTFDAVNYQLVVGRPFENIVTLFRPYSIHYLPIIRR